MAKPWATDKMKHPKAHYRALSYGNLKWVGFWDGYHHFTEHVEGKGYTEMRVGEEQLTNGDAEFMAEHNLTL